MKRVLSLGILLLAVFSLVPQISAHVTIDPKQGLVGSQIITVRVPNERKIPTTELRVVVPEGVDVTGILPVSGWSHSEKRTETPKMSGTSGMPTQTEEDDHDHEESTGPISEITWTGGKIGVDEFTEFKISIHSTMEKTTVWKTYQKYSDGVVVAWDDSSEKNPAPKVELTGTKTTDNSTAMTASSTADTMQSQWLSVGAIILSVASLAIGLRKK